MVAQALPAGKRYDCVGLLYYSAFMQQTGAVPVCMGFSAVREEAGNHSEPAALERKEQPAQHQQVAAPEVDPAAAQAAAHHDFKMLCVGYSSFCPSATGLSALPHCEGLEVVLHGPTPGSHDEHHHQQAGSGGKAHHHDRSDGVAASSSFAAGRAQQQQEEEPATAGSIVARLVSKAAQNVSLMQTALSNEGPVKLKPLPKDLDDLQARVTATLEKHGGRMQRGVERMATNAYVSTVKPLVAILGLSGGSSGATTRSPKSP